MSGRRHDEREDYDDRPRRKPSMPTWLIAVVLGFFVLGVVLFAVSALIFWFRPAVPPPPMAGPAPVAGPATGAMKKTYTREEFKKLVMWKTMDEVKALLGAPDRTRDAAGGVVRWHYNHRSVDPTNGKPDILAEVNFDKDGVVASVNF
jgi:hypothetical protein